jgi:alpha-tubulin suppressor-like RCC1 family protein
LTLTPSPRSKQRAHLRILVLAASCLTSGACSAALASPGLAQTPSVPEPAPLSPAPLSPAPLSPAIAPEEAHTWIVGWGKNAAGALGAGYIGPTRGPASTLLSGVRSAVAADSSYALLDNGTVDAWGDNTFGQLGNGTHVDSAVPEPVDTVTDAVAIAAAGEHAMALLANGTVATWGGNGFGTLGNGTSGKGHEVGEPNPVLVPGLSGVVAIAAGGGDDVALLEDGTLEAWGENRAGQLGDGTTVEKDVPTPVKGVTGVRAVAVGGNAPAGAHVLALLDNGTVMAWGENGGGELGDGTSVDSSTPVTVTGLNGVSAISADVTHSMALLEDGTLLTWGSDAYGQLGVTRAPEQCEARPCSRLPVPVALKDVSSISAGFRYSLAVSSGKSYAWGWNLDAQLGNDAKPEEPLPTRVPGVGQTTAVSAGAYHSLALVSEPGPPAALELSPGSSSLTVRWLEGGEPNVPWLVRWRPAHVHAAWSTLVRVAPSARSYTIDQLTAIPYEVLIRNLAGFGRRAIVGTPLAGG